MKKILMLLAVGVLMFGVAGQAMAAFTTDDLIRVAYGNGYEYATDLGNLSSLTSPITTQMNFTADPISLTGFPTGTTLNQLTVAYYMYTNSANGVDTSNQVWASGLSSTGQWNTTHGFLAFATAASSNLSGYLTGTLSTDGNSSLLASTSPYSYLSQMGTIGSLANYINVINKGSGISADLSLATLPGVQYLYYYGPGIVNPSSTQQGVLIAEILTLADGTSELVPIPIPAAVYLLGSGLLGLIGIRRRMMA